MSGEALERELTLMRACWAFFDEVRSRVSPEMQRGPRGGGRDRDHIVRHVIATELGWAKKLGLPASQDALLTDEGLIMHRDAYCDAIRALHSQGKMARTWPLNYLIRHSAFHTLDHAWEMEDKDLRYKDITPRKIQLIGFSDRREEISAPVAVKLVHTSTAKMRSIPFFSTKFADADQIQPHQPGQQLYSPIPWPNPAGNLPWLWLQCFD